MLLASSAFTSSGEREQEGKKRKKGLTQHMLVPGLYSSLPLFTETRSKTLCGCLKLQIEPNPMCTMFFPIHTHLFS